MNSFLLPLPPHPCLCSESGVGVVGGRSEDGTYAAPMKHMAACTPDASHAHLWLSSIRPRPTCKHASTTSCPNPGVKLDLGGGTFDLCERRSRVWIARPPWGVSVGFMGCQAGMHGNRCVPHNSCCLRDGTRSRREGRESVFLAGVLYSFLGRPEAFDSMFIRQIQLVFLVGSLPGDHVTCHDFQDKSCLVPHGGNAKLLWFYFIFYSPHVYWRQLTPRLVRPLTSVICYIQWT